MGNEAYTGYREMVDQQAATKRWAQAGAVASAGNLMATIHYGRQAHRDQLRTHSLQEQTIQGVEATNQQLHALRQDMNEANQVAKAQGYAQWRDGTENGSYFHYQYRPKAMALLEQRAELSERLQRAVQESQQKVIGEFPHWKHSDWKTDALGTGVFHEAPAPSSPPSREEKSYGHKSFGTRDWVVATALGFVAFILVLVYLAGASVYTQFQEEQRVADKYVALLEDVQTQPESPERTEQERDLNRQFQNELRTIEGDAAPNGPLMLLPLVVGGGYLVLRKRGVDSYNSRETARRDQDNAEYAAQYQYWFDAEMARDEAWMKQNLQSGQQAQQDMVRMVGIDTRKKGWVLSWLDPQQSAQLDRVSEILRNAESNPPARDSLPELTELRWNPTFPERYKKALAGNGQ